MLQVRRSADLAAPGRSQQVISLVSRGAGAPRAVHTELQAGNIVRSGAGNGQSGLQGQRWRDRLGENLE